MERILSVKIENQDSGRSIAKLLRNQLGLSRTMLSALKRRDKGIMLNNLRAYSNAILKEGDLLTLQLEEEFERSENISPTKGELNIVYEDEDVLIINKQPNLPVHPSKGHESDTLANIVIWYYQNKGENFKYRCVNRLDSGTSGLMAIAKNAHAHARLMLQLKNGELLREYLAVACGSVENDEGTIDLPIGRKPNLATIKREVREDGNNAVTHYRVLARTKKFTLLRLQLETGRTHQIRVHMAHIGHPLVGDFLYGNEDKELITRHALHSTSITLLQPVTGKTLSFTAPMPEDMMSILEDDN